MNNENRNSLNMNEKDEKKVKKSLFKKQNFVLSLCVNTFVVFSVLFFAPIEVYLGNIIEFAFPFKYVFMVLFGFCTGVVIIASLVEAFLKKTAGIVINMVVFSLGLCCYIQAFLLNGKMTTMTGEITQYGLGTVVSNLLVWVAIVCAVVILTILALKKDKKKLLLTGTKFVSLALVAMQTVALMSLLLTAETSSFVKNDYLTNEGQYSLADGENVVVFILDTLDVNFVDATLSEYPDLFDELDGFTYFPNATSTHSRTYPSVPYMLTGQMCYFDMPYKEYVNNAYENSSFINDLHKNNTDIRLYTENQYIGDSAKEIISNHAEFKQNSFSSISSFQMIKQMMKVSLFREAPYAVKSKFEYVVGDINSSVLTVTDKFAAEDEALFYENLKKENLSKQDHSSAFRFFHFWGAHPGCSINEKGESVGKENTTMTKAIKGDFHIIEEYLKQMQELGLYEQSTIIITADHGSSGGSETSLDLPTTARPIIVAKPAGVGKDQKFKISNAPVCHEDLIPTIVEAVGGDKSKYGRTLFEIQEDEQRDRYYYYTALYSDTDGEVALREYKVTGDAKHLENWVLTGKYWDVNYSERAVSKNRLHKNK